jgi:predicted DNA-binding protein (MmcQ/YjbR family)
MAARPKAVSPRTRLETFALAFPGSWRDTPWEGDIVAKVAKKIFVFFGETSISVKLPDSADQALAAPGASPTSYGLGRHGWVTVPFAGNGAPDLAVVEDWIEESYRAVAPKKLIAELAADEPR